jgi:hypothetical protein
MKKMTKDETKKYEEEITESYEAECYFDDTCCCGCNDHEEDYGLDWNVN